MPRPMPLRPTTIRFAEDSMQFIQQAADEVGSSAAQFIREAALIRAAMILHRDDPMKKISEKVRQFARDEE